MSRVRLPFAAIIGIALITIAACGGGGGGSSNPPAQGPVPAPDPPTPPPSNGQSPPLVPQVTARLTTANGRSFSIGAMHAFRMADTHLLDDAGVAAYDVRPPEPNPLYDGFPLLQWYVRRAIEAEAQHPPADGALAELLSCDQGSYRVSGGFAGADGTGTLRMDFDRCRHGADGVELNGVLALGVERRTGSSVEEYVYHYEQLRVAIPALRHEVRLNGSVHITEDDESSTASEAIDATVDDLTRRVRYAIKGFVTEFVRSEPWQSWSAVRRHGEVGVSDHGFAQIGMLDSHPRLSADASSLLLESNRYLAIYLDSNGDGKYDQVARGSQGAWDLAPGAPNQSPQLVVLVAPGAIGEPARLIVNETLDPDFDFMRWEYVLESWPAGATHEINFDVITGVLQLDADTPGDYPVRIVVTDHRGLAAMQTVNARVRFDRPEVEITAPEFLPEGESLTIVLNSTNDRAGPLSYVIRGAMPGMTMTGDGIVSWDPAVFPLFGTEVVRILLEVSNPDHRLVFAVPIVVADTYSRLPRLYAGLQPPGAESSIRPYRQRDGAPTELLLGTLRGVAQRIQWGGSTFRPSWAYPVALGGGTIDVAGHDMDGDGELEVVVHAGTEVRVLDGQTRRQMAQSGHFIFGAAGPLRTGDFNADGTTEVVIVKREQGNPAVFDIRVLRWPDLLETKLLQPPQGAGFMDVARLVPGAPFSLVATPGRIYDMVTFLQHPTPPPLPGRFVIGNVDDDPALEIIKLTDAAVQIHDGATMALEAAIALGFPADFVELTGPAHSGRQRILTGGPGSPLLIFDAALSTSTPVRSIPLPITEPGRQKVAVGTFTAAGNEQIFWSFTHDGHRRHTFAVIDPATGATAWRSAPGDVPSGPFWGGAPESSASAEHLFLGRIDEQGRHDWIWMNSQSGAVRRAAAFEAEAIAALEQDDWNGDGHIDTFVHLAFDAGAPGQINRYSHSGALEATFPAISGHPGPIRTVALAGQPQKHVVAVVGSSLVQLDPATGAIVASIAIANDHCTSGSVHDLVQSSSTGLLYVPCDRSVLAYEVRPSGLLRRHVRTEDFSSRRGPIALISDPRDGAERVAVVLQFDVGVQRRLEVLTTSLDEIVAARQLHRSLALNDFASMFPLAGGGLLLAYGAPGKPLRETYLEILDPFGLDTGPTWRSPPMPGWLTSRSLRADLLGDGVYRVAFASDAAAFITR